MVFVRFKHIKTTSGKSHSYLYLVKNYWDKDKQQSRQKVIFYLGKIEGMNPFDVEQVFKRDGARCKKCGRQDTLTIDHIMPTSKSGNNDLDNLQILCMRCNQKKRNKLPQPL